MDPEKPCWHRSDPTFSQKVTLRKESEKVVKSCCLVDQTSVGDIQAVVQNEDIASVTLCHDSDEELLNSMIDNSCISNDGSAPETIDNVDDDYSNSSRPYVPFSIEEVSLVKTLSVWSNRNVRVIGTASPIENVDYNMWKLVSIGEEGGPFSISVDLRLVNFPSANCPIQIFGELQMLKNNTTPVILAKFFRDFSSVDIFYHNKSVEELKKYIPHFIDRRNSQTRMLDDSD
ncbi:uncharacterized protein LOC117645064 isoform X1 [Thrips palmi]|uniref:Uncharacterized protein LOC117645064 isoform X1 n=1 Tax=Thrips palmi TaxID=161013 RepID=A0A6P8YTR6_THRPL|nr:uncharacterized protein LOC117645064 isoform X1 [Thrips palmi]